MSLPVLPDNSSSSNSVAILGVLASGSGSNFEAIACAIEQGKLPAKIALVIYNEPELLPNNALKSLVFLQF